MEQIRTIITELKYSIPTVDVLDVIDVLLVAFLIYEVLRLIQHSSGARIARAILLILIAVWVTDLLNMYTMHFLLSYIVQIGAIALIIVFQPELRRFLEKIGKKSSMKELFYNRTASDGTEKTILQVVSACEIMAREKTGVLIVFERDTPLNDYFRTGTILDAQVSSELLRNLFFTNASLHDGAVILRNDRIAAAGCVLPLSDNSRISTDLGTRHRAAIGISEETDAIAVVVSEETGTISLAVDGMLKRYLSAQTLRTLLINALMPKQDETTSSKAIRRIRGIFAGKKEEEDE